MFLEATMLCNCLVKIHVILPTYSWVPSVAQEWTVKWSEQELHLDFCKDKFQCKNTKKYPVQNDIISLIPSTLRVIGGRCQLMSSHCRRETR